MAVVHSRSPREYTPAAQFVTKYSEYDTEFELSTKNSRKHTTTMAEFLSCVLPCWDLPATTRRTPCGCRIVSRGPWLVPATRSGLINLLLLRERTGPTLPRWNKGGRKSKAGQESRSRAAAGRVSVPVLVSAVLVSARNLQSHLSRLPSPRAAVSLLEFL